MRKQPGRFTATTHTIDQNDPAIVLRRISAMEFSGQGGIVGTGLIKVENQGYLLVYGR